MRIAYLVDIHGRFSAVFEALARLGLVDLLLIGGDITTGGSPDDVEEAVKRWQRLAPRLFAVAGNVDSAEIDARLADLGVGLDSRGVTIGEVGFGLSGAPQSPLHTPYELDDAELERRIKAAYSNLGNCRVKIFCPHAPPRDTQCDRLPSGEHVGSTVVRAFIEREQPDLVLCGHIHSGRGTEQIGLSRVVNPGPANEGHYALIEVGEEIRVSLDP